MTVTRDVVRDLLPGYAAGEASADTKQLVEEWIKRDAGLADELAALSDDRPSALMAEGPSRDDVHRVIALTRTLIRRRTFYLVGAVIATLLPALSLVYRLDGVHFPLDRLPGFMPLSLLAAAGCWTMVVLTVKRLRVSGL
jgi:hypothetical protein